MKIARYIGDLLYDYECVVIPGLGGFLTNDKPASIQPNTHHFRPPYKQVMFNAYLKTNDGLLVNYIAREEGISYKEAKSQVDKFVYLCDNALRAGKRINFHNVGYLYLNKNEKIVFEQDTTINYNADAFGLTGFISPAVRRTNPEEKLREAVNPGNRKKSPAAAKENTKQGRKAVHAQDRKAEKRIRMQATQKKSPYKTQIVFLVVLVIAMIVGWGFMNKDKVNAYYNNYSSVIPLFYTQPNAYLINNIDRVPITKVSSSRFGSWWISLFEKHETAPAKTGSVKKEAEKPESSKTTVISSTPKAMKKTEKTPVGTTSKNTIGRPVVHTPKPAAMRTTAKSVPTKRMIPSTHFYIIAGAFKDRHNATRLIFKLQHKGYRATQAGVTRSGLLRVAYGAFNNRIQAEKQLVAIREKVNPAAWILVK